MSNDENVELFEAPIEVQLDIAAYDAQREAIAAYDAGEIDLWVNHTRPKTGEGWQAWREELKELGIHDIENRWKQKAL